MKLFQLFETPLKGVSYHRDPEEKDGSFDERDRKLIEKYIRENTYKEHLKGVPFDLYIYIVDDQALKSHRLDFPEGEVTDDQVERGAYRYETDEGTRKIDLKKATIAAVLKKVLEDREKDPNGVFFMIGDNYGGDKNQIGLTPWIMVHRLMHAIFKKRSDFERAIGNLAIHFFFRTMENKKRNTFRLPFKSAKNGTTDDYGELRAEIGTYIIINGKFKYDGDGLEDQFKAVIDKDSEIAVKSAKTLVDHIKGKIFYI